MSYLQSTGDAESKCELSGVKFIYWHVDKDNVGLSAVWVLIVKRHCCQYIHVVKRLRGLRE